MFCSEETDEDVDLPDISLSDQDNPRFVSCQVFY